MLEAKVRVLAPTSAILWALEWMICGVTLDKRQFIDEYTITMDVKLLDEPPRDSISLFQTALIHAKENRRAVKQPSVNQKENAYQPSWRRWTTWLFW